MSRKAPGSLGGQHLDQETKLSLQARLLETFSSDVGWAAPGGKREHSTAARVSAEPKTSTLHRPESNLTRFALDLGTHPYSDSGIPYMNRTHPLINPSDQTVATIPPLSSLVDWPAIIAGGVIAAGMSFVLLSFGSAVGFAVSSPFASEGASAATIGMMAIVWFAFSQIYSFAAGGYVAGRLRAPAGDTKDRDEIQFRDGMSGLVVWASALVISAVLIASTAAGVTRMAASGVGQAIGSAATAAAANTDYLTDVFLRTSTPAALAGPASAPPLARSEADIRAEIGRILSMGIARGQVTEDDRQRLSTLLSSRSSIPQEEARKRVDEAITKADAVQQEVKLRAQAVAETARSATSRAAFWATVIMMLTGVAAWYAAQFGGRHRDERAS